MVRRAGAWGTLRTEDELLQASFFTGDLGLLRRRLTRFASCRQLIVNEEFLSKPSNLQRNQAARVISFCSALLSWDHRKNQQANWLIDLPHCLDAIPVPHATGNENAGLCFHPHKGWGLSDRTIANLHSFLDSKPVKVL